MFDWLRQRIAHQALYRIAALDDGAHGVQQNLVHMRQIHRTGLIPRPIEYPLWTVLSMGSAGRGEDSLASAWCSTLLCLSHSANGLDRLYLHDTALRLANRCLELGPEASAHAEQLLTWRYMTGGCLGVIDQLDAHHCDHDDDQDDEETDLSALLALLVLRAAANPGDEHVDLLARRLIQHQQRPTNQCDVADGLAPATPRLSAVLADSREIHGWDNLIDHVLVPVRRTHGAYPRILDTGFMPPGPA